MKLLSRMISRFASPSPSPSPVRARAASLVEPLEGRQLLHAAVTGVVADNRGETSISFNGALDPATVTKQSVVVFTAGKDGVLNTADDTHIGAPVSYVSSSKRVVIKGRTIADQAFRVRLVAKLLHAADGAQIDGEFNGS